MLNSAPCYLLQFLLLCILNEFMTPRLRKNTFNYLVIILKLFFFWKWKYETTIRIARLASLLLRTCCFVYVSSDSIVTCYACYCSFFSQIFWIDNHICYVFWFKTFTILSISLYETPFSNYLQIEHQDCILFISYWSFLKTSFMFHPSNSHHNIEIIILKTLIRPRERT